MENPVRLRDATEWLQQESWIKWLAMVTALVVAAIVLLLRFAGLLEPLELAAYDRALVFRAFDNSSDVVVVTISDDDLNSWGWPVPDGRLAQIGNNALSAGAKLVGFDIYRDVAIAPGTDELSALFKDSRIVGISKLSSPLSPSISAAPNLLNDGRYGYSDLLIDADGVVRRALLLVQENGRTSLSFALKMAMMAKEGKGTSALGAVRDDPHTLMIGSTALPRLRADEGGYAEIDNRGYQVLIDYFDRTDSISIIPVSRVLANATERDKLSGKIVLVGTVSESVKDLFLTPHSRGSKMTLTSGVLIHGVILDQMLRYQAGKSQPVRAIPSWAESIAIVFFALGGALSAFASQTILRIIVLGPIAASLIVLIGGAFLLLDWWLPSVVLGLAWFASFVAVVGEVSLIANRQRRQLFSVFSTYVSPVLADEIWRNRKLFLSGGKPRPMRLDVTVLFIDLAGSTRLGGAMDPQAFVDWVGRFLDAIAAVVTKFGGLIEKFTGDGVMVIFGAPIPRTSIQETRADAERACSCAIEMAETVEVLNAGAMQGVKYAARIGVHSGELLSGVFGDKNRLQYSVIGDTANIAARMEAFGKKLKETAEKPVIVCVSENTASRLDPIWQLKPAGTYTHDDGFRQIPVYLLTGRTSKRKD